LVAPLLKTTLMAIVDLVSASEMKLKLQQAAHRGAELATIETTSVVDSDVQSEAATAAGVSTNNVTVSKWMECGTNTTQLNFSTGTCSSGDKAQYVQVSVTGSYTAKFVHHPFASSTVALTGKAVVRVK